MGQKVSCVQSAPKYDGAYDCESNKERAASLNSSLNGDAREIRHLIKVNKTFFIVLL